MTHSIAIAAPMLQEIRGVQRTGRADTDSTTPGVTRDVGIDRFRGGLIVLMVSGNYAAGVAWVPSYLKHATGSGFTVADIVAPAFVFAIGLTYGASFQRRAKRGVAMAYRHFITRNLALIGIGAILSLVSTNFMHAPRYWGVLQALGAASLLALVVIRLGTAWRFALGIAMIAAYQLGLDQSKEIFREVTSSSLGGAYGVLAWAALLVLSTAVADLARRGTGGSWLRARSCGLLVGRRCRSEY